ncbi:MAG: peptide deformylase [Candidatus Brocadiae bacterium]|nr:peptide deformylase [Candidatus Brocadiia bacterium]
MEILKWPHEALEQVAEPIRAVDDEVRAMAEEMLNAMAAARGVGLAGPQVGYLKRLIVLNLTPGSPDGERVYVNPEILSREGESFESEGCLSIPGVNGKVLRATRVVVRAVTLDSATVTVEADGLLARAFQHEIDHLEGILITRHFNAVDRTANARALRELEKAGRARAGSRR